MALNGLLRLKECLVDGRLYFIVVSLFLFTEGPAGLIRTGLVGWLTTSICVGRSPISLTI